MRDSSPQNARVIVKDTDRRYHLFIRCPDVTEDHDSVARVSPLRRGKGLCTWCQTEATKRREENYG